MHRTRRYWLWLAILYVGVLGLLAAFGLVIDASLDAARSEAFRTMLATAAPALLYGAGLALFICAAVLSWIFRNYPHAASQLAEQTRIVLAANPDYRITSTGGIELKQLAATINQLADAHRHLTLEMDARSLEAKVRAEEERDRFAALMSELSEGVLVCNADGRILLYNERAAQLLGRSQTETARNEFIPLGLGRSVFSLLDRNQVAHALDKIQHQFDHGVERPHTRFVTSAAGRAGSGALLRVQVAPFLSGEARGEARGEAKTERPAQHDGAKQGAKAEAKQEAKPGAKPAEKPAADLTAPRAERRVAGMVFTLDDVSGLVGREGQRLKLLQSIATEVRAPVANLRAAAESLTEFPEMPTEQRMQFERIVAAEARVLTDRLNTALREYADALKGSLTLEDMRVVDLLAAVQRRLAEALGLNARLGEVDANLWVRVDSFAVVQAFVSLATRLRDEYSVRDMQLQAGAHRGFAEIDLVWTGAIVGADALPLWETEPMRAGGDETPLTLKDVLDRHGGELWSQTEKPGDKPRDNQRDKTQQTSWFRFVLPLGAPVATVARHAVAVDGRPEYYDFDLFDRIESAGDLVERRLSELTYTVFDTETTGLQPSAGDEIISIGAVRIVNGRLLKQEVFEQLVNPRRSISRDAMRVHGIDGGALLSEPPLEQVLPQFHRFCEDTVLVGHNAAFDMRFLELKEAATGIRFTQPVLDTLLLSAVVHPSLENHNLDTVAERLGVRVIGRHTALGDALVTGEIFLRLLSLLAERGIVTLGQALEASRATFHARLQY